MTAFSEMAARALGLEPSTAAVIARLGSLAITAIGLLVVYRIVVQLIERLVARRQLGTPRIRTVGLLLVNVTRWLLAFVVLVVVLTELGIDVRALLVSAGLVGLAVGFGAQTLVRDLIAGLFILVEGLIAVGDDIEVGAHRGIVESVGLRVTRVRLPSGAVRVVPNGQVADFINHSSDWGQATIDVTVGRDADVNRALDTLRGAGEAWARESGVALETPEAHGIIKITGGDVVLRLIVRVAAARRVHTECELRRRIKEAFDREQLPLLGAS
jgi:small conductance mechanosensitive channel